MTLYFDGGCRPNPGPMEAAVVARGETRFRAAGRSGDNNEAEWLAALFALEIARAAGARDVVLIGDSAYVVAQARGRGRRPAAPLAACRDAFHAAAAGFVRIRVRRVARAKNLAGIALARRDAARRQAEAFAAGGARCVRD